MPTVGILVANASQAAFYTAPRVGGPVTQVDGFDHPLSRKKGIDLAADRPGRQKSKGTGHGVMVESSDPKDVEIERFARELVESIQSARHDNLYERLVLVAPPQFLGLLKNIMDQQMLNQIHLTIGKDYTKANERELIAYLEEERP